MERPQATSTHIKAAPYLKALTATLSLILPVASSTTKLMMSDDQYKSIEKQLAFGAVSSAG